jgi:hypothetical protein
MALSADEGAGCVSRSGGDAMGAGLRWSLHGGFGFCWQGKGMRELQRLTRRNEINLVCPPGDPNPICRTVPRR